MEVPGSLYLVCPKCGEETLHKVLKGKAGKGKNPSLTATIECGQCEHVRKEVIKGEKKKQLRLIVSHRGNSFKDKVEFLPDEVLKVGDVFLYKEYDVRITGIETERARVGRAMVEKIITLWVKRFDAVDVRVSIMGGERTSSFKIQCEPKDEFEVGQEMLIQGTTYFIEKIRIPDMTLKRPKRGAFACDIKRIYLKKPPGRRSRGRKQGRGGKPGGGFPRGKGTSRKGRKNR
jgi:uncharacterized Zn finger protein